MNPIPNLHIDGAENREEALPEARLTHHRTTICGPIGLMSKVFCVNCGASGGLITEEWAKSVFFVCDACDEKLGKVPCPQIPDAVVQGKQPLV